MPINIELMLEKISNITSLSSMNTTHSFQFTFVLIGEHVVDTFQVHAICVTYNKLADLDSNMLRDKQSEKSFKMHQMLVLMVSINSCCQHVRTIHLKLEILCKAKPIHRKVVHPHLGALSLKTILLNP